MEHSPLCRGVERRLYGLLLGPVHQCPEYFFVLLEIAEKRNEGKESEGTGGNVGGKRKVEERGLEFHTQEERVRRKEKKERKGRGRKKGNERKGKGEAVLRPYVKTCKEKKLILALTCS